MTTTSTAPAKAPTDPIAELREAQVQLDSARAENTRLRERRDNYAAQLRQAQTELDQLAADKPSQFNDEGLPKKDSRAAKLRGQLDAAQKSTWPAVIAGSDQRVEEAERDMRRLMKQHAVPLAAAEHDKGVQAIERVRALTGELRQALAQVRAPEATLTAITTSLGPAIDGRNVWTDARLGELERACDSAQHLLPARLVDLTPYHGETPRVFLCNDGGWVLARSADQADLAEQPQPIEPPA